MGKDTKKMITVEEIITTLTLVGAVATLIGGMYAIFKWYDKQNRQDDDIKKIKEEQCMLTYCMLACLDGLKQLGANGNVTTAHDKLSKHINQSAHDCTE